VARRAAQEEACESVPFGTAAAKVGSSNEALVRCSHGLLSARAVKHRVSRALPLVYECAGLRKTDL
jgi:hypothetical protein